MTMPTHTCYSVRKRGEDRKSYWMPIGSAWTNSDGSFNVKLDALPIDGEIVIRLRRDDAEAAKA
jgi:hypothetical protein